VARAADVIIVGAGIIGCAIAREMTRRGAQVRVFEARAVGAGATQASAGVLAPYIEAPRQGPLLDLAVRSLQMYDAFVQELREDSGVAIEYRRAGTMEVATEAGTANQLASMIAESVLADAGAEWLPPVLAREREPSLPDSIHGALLIRAHAYVAATQLTEALTWAALRHGAEFETGRRVSSVRGDAEGVEVVAEDGSTWNADAAVIATGSWTVPVDGVVPAPPLRPVRGQLLRLSWRGEPMRHVIWGPDCYVVPWNDGTVLVGATVEDVGFDERTTAAGVRDLLDAACELLPAAWGATFIDARVGLRPATPDGLPLLGPAAGAPRIVYAGGHYRNGVLLAPITGALVSAWLLDKQTDEAFAALTPDRFNQG
jgi:glycine oxidase